MNATNIAGYRLAVLAWLVAWTIGHPSDARAQDSSSVDRRHTGKMVRVTLALPQRDVRNSPVVIRAQGRERNDLIVLRNEGLTTEMIATTVASLSGTIRLHGIVAPRNAMVRTRSGGRPPALDERNQMHYAALLQRLRNAPLQEVPGLGVARTVDFFVLVPQQR